MIGQLAFVAKLEIIVMKIEVSSVKFAIFAAKFPLLLLFSR